MLILTVKECANETRTSQKTKIKILAVAEILNRRSIIPIGLENSTSKGSASVLEKIERIGFLRGEYMYFSQPKAISLGLSPYNG